MLRIVFSEPDRQRRGAAIFLDRDGVINRRRPDDYVLSFSQFEFVPGIRAALKSLAALGWPLILISNQAAVGKGLLDRAGLEEITRRMQQTLVGDGASLSAAYFCTHRTEDNCSCRKPKPGLLHQASSDFHIELGRSIFIGDSQTDVLAARAAGCAPILLGAGVRNGPGATDWTANLAIARRPEALLDIAAKCLHQLESV